MSPPRTTSLNLCTAGEAITLSTQILAISTPLFSEGQIHSSQADGESPMCSQAGACLGCWTLQLHLGHSDKVRVYP